MQLTEKKAEKAPTVLTTLQALAQEDFANMQTLMITELASEVPLINEVAQHILEAGGKRLRPLILLITAKALGYTQHCAELNELAAIIELIHTATLLHDDVVDGSTQRRNRPTANALWGNAASVLAGDFLYSRAFQILARRDNIPVMRLLAKTTNRISEGEVWQLMNVGNSALSEADYLNVIRCKTAELYSAASQIGAMLATQHDATYCAAAAHYGLMLGMAFQMIDDLLDYAADPAETGKNLGDDLAEGKVTLPLIHTLHHGTTSQQEVIREAILSGGKTNMDQVMEVITKSGGLAYTQDAAKLHAQQAQIALQPFPKNIYSDALNDLCDFVLTRRY